jgi:hypothetical protein
MFHTTGYNPRNNRNTKREKEEEVKSLQKVCYGGGVMIYNKYIYFGENPMKEQPSSM